MSPDKKEQEALAFKRESLLIKERQCQTVPIGGKVRYIYILKMLTDKFNGRRLQVVAVLATLLMCQPLMTSSLNIGLP